MSTQSTADRVLAALASYDLKRESNAKWRSNSPLRPGANSHSFSITINGPEHGAYNDFVSGDKGSLYQLANKLGVSTAKAMNSSTDTRYDYTDEQGVLLYQAVRYYDRSGGKRFYQQQPDGKGGWIKSITKPSVRRVLYRLPEVIKAISKGETIYIVEGEKDAETLRMCGKTATCNAGGAGKWLDVYSDVLHDADVAIVPDNDKPGHDHAVQVAASLHGKAKRIRIVALPSLSPKGDVSDWLDAGNAIDEFDQIVEFTPDYTHAANSTGQSASGTSTPNVVPGSLSQSILTELTRLGYTFRLNLLHDVIEVNGQPNNDIIAARIRTQMRDRDIKPLEAVEDVYITAAADNAYHPIKDYLNSLVWDGNDHIAALAAKLTSKDTPIIYPDGTRKPLHLVYLLRWLIAAVAKVFDQKQNVMLVFSGPQDIGKSAFARWLCSAISAYHIESHIDPQNKDCDVYLMSKFIWEVAELDATTRRADVSGLKAFLTKETVTVRKAYGRHETVKPACASFFGTINPSSGFLSDDTGNRRFMVAGIESIDWSYTDLDVGQIWAQVVTLYRNGEPWRLLPCESARQMKQNKEYETPSLLEDRIKQYFNLQAGDHARLTSGEIATHLREQGCPLSGSDKAQSMELSAALKRLGVQKKHTDTWRGYIGIRAKDSVIDPSNMPPDNLDEEPDNLTVKVVRENTVLQSHSDNLTTSDNLNPKREREVEREKVYGQGERHEQPDLTNRKRLSEVVSRRGCQDGATQSLTDADRLQLVRDQVKAGSLGAAEQMAELIRNDQIKVQATGLIKEAKPAPTRIVATKEHVQATKEEQLRAAARADLRQLVDSSDIDSIDTFMAKQRGSMRKYLQDLLVEWQQAPA